MVIIEDVKNLIMKLIIMKTSDFSCQNFT